MTDFGNGEDPNEGAHAGLDEIAGDSPEQPTNPTDAQPQEQPQEPEAVEPAASEETQAAAAPDQQPESAEPRPEAEPAKEQAPAVESTVDAGEPAAEVPQAAGEPPAAELPAGAQGEAPEVDEAAASAGEPHGAPRRGGQRSWRPPRLSKEEMREIWTELQARRDAGEEIELEVVGHNRGGVVTQYKGLEVFIPMSHWNLERQNAGEPGDVKVGSTVPANILEITDFETDARRVTATRRATLRRHMMDAFQVGQQLTGTVASIHDFGVFVDLGGIDGLVHASEISHMRGRHPSELVKIGDSVNVVVKEIDPQRERIYLGMRELGPSPWDTAEEKYPVGMIVQGRVAGFSKNGAFVELEPGIEGFVRMRELSWTKRVQRPKEILKKSAEIPVKVLEISGRRQRLSLSYRQAIEDPWPQIAEKYAVGTNWKGHITELSNKGVVVDLGEVEGFLPRGRMGREAKRLPDMKAGDELEVNVIEVDASRNSLIFGMAGQEQAGGGRFREGGERGERPERSERSDRGERGERGERRERRGDRDRDRGGFAPPARPVDEIKSAETVGNFSLGDLLGDQIKSKLGIREEPRPRRERPAEEAPARSESAAEPEARTTPEMPAANEPAVEPAPPEAAPQTPEAAPAAAESSNEVESPKPPEAEPRDPEAAAGDENTGD